ncbi:type II secretion system F family protein [Pseudarthrobacter sp. AL07]|uniref:type II secretion system F family protein n=1 Tax=unclassified Pseudarthrobacter TaxID=2647000 RepID=UPI00249B5FB2|nr:MULTISPECIES: type II secretion system F family protein [unclassified Pseudarthrobacter]MDI3193769.1 type II secretion system F family protein [Pseudarthrobacter sp. AL20]MDI3207721.1 type II secretion system F family protein [Pseudarthrobacter sp. AL07]
MATDMPVSLFIGGLLLVYLSLVLLFGVVFRGRAGVPLSRRRPDAVQNSSSLTRLTNQAVGALNRGLKSRPAGFFSRERLEQAGLNKEPGDYLLMAGAITLVATVLGFFLGGVGIGILSSLLSPFLLYLAVNVLIGRRRRKFDEQVPDTLQMFSGGLRAGHSLLRAIDAAAQESEAPMSEELSRVVNETRIGRDLGESLADVSRRTASEDFYWIAQAIEIHREVGGDLAEVLDHVGETIRDRNQVRGQVRALSAEGRVSALVLMALPICMFIGLVLFNPLYAKVFTTTVIGFAMLGAAVLLLSVGGLWLSRIIKPKY